MTLATRIAVVDPVNPEKLHAFITRLVGGNPETAIIKRSPGRIENELDQGFGAIVHTTFGLDGPLPDRAANIAIEQAQNPDWYGENYKGEYHCPVAHAVVVWMDTTYGMQEHQGVETDCASFHAWIIECVNAWVPEGTQTWWYDESGDGWHFGTDAMMGHRDRVEALRALLPKLAPSP